MLVMLVPSDAVLSLRKNGKENEVVFFLYKISRAVICRYPENSWIAIRKTLLRQNAGIVTTQKH